MKPVFTCATIPLPFAKQHVRVAAVTERPTVDYLNAVVGEIDK